MRVPEIIKGIGATVVILIVAPILTIVVFYTAITLAPAGFVVVAVISLGYVFFKSITGWAKRRRRHRELQQEIERPRLIEPPRPRVATPTVPDPRVQQLTARIGGLTRARNYWKQRADTLERRAQKQTKVQQDLQRAYTDATAAIKESEAQVPALAPFKLITTPAAHRHALVALCRQAEREVTIISPWITRDAFNPLCTLFAAMVERKVRVRIVWGMPRQTAPQSHAAAQLPAASQRYWRVVGPVNTHEKLVLCDDRCCIWGSFNWLSNSGQGNSMETSAYSERPDEVAAWRALADDYFRTTPAGREQLQHLNGLPLTHSVGNGT